MSRVKWALAMVILILAAACTDQKSTPTAPQADTPENRKAAAQRYFEAVPPQEMLQTMAKNLSPRLPEQNRKAFLEAMSSKEMADATHRIAMDALVKHFTPAELHALAAFYSTPEGKSTRAKFGTYMADVMPQIGEEVRNILAKMQEQSKPEQPQAAPPQAAPAKPQPPKAEQPKPATPKPEPAKPEQPKSK